MGQNLQGNIWKYTLILIANKRIFVAILGVYYLTIPDVTAQTIGILLLIGQIAGFLFEIPSGYVSDKIGHKKALVVSRVSMLGSTALFLLASNTMFLALGGVFLAISNAFQSGTGSAFMHETLRGLKREHDYTRIMGKISSIGFAVPIIFMMTVPFLVSISYKLPFIISLVTDTVGLFATLALIAPKVSPEHVEEIRATNFWQVIREGHRLHFFVFSLFSGIISGVFFAVGGFRSPYQSFLEIPVIWFGVLFGLGRMGASLMLAYSGRMKQTMTVFSFYRFELILYTVLLFSLGVATTWWVVAGVFLVSNAFQWGLSRIDEGYQMDIIKTSKFKATLLSVGAQMELLIGAVASFGLGFAIEHLSYRYGFFSLSVVFVAFLLPLYIFIAKRYKNDPHFAL
ncbi:MAG: MFS transporter [Candidatus Moraniibacteriota bacterium]